MVRLPPPKSETCAKRPVLNFTKSGPTKTGPAGPLGTSLKGPMHIFSYPRHVTTCCRSLPALSAFFSPSSFLSPLVVFSAALSHSPSCVASAAFPSRGLNVVTPTASGPLTTSLFSALPPSAVGLYKKKVSHYVHTYMDNARNHKMRVLIHMHSSCHENRWLVHETT